MTKSRNKRPGKVTVDSALLAAGAGVHRGHLTGINSDNVAFLTLRERQLLTTECRYAEQGKETRLAGLLLDTEEAEKKRIARELHDGLGQLLTSINLHVQQCINSSNASDQVTQTLKDSLKAISSMTKQAMGEVRGICCALRPAILDDLGVLAAIKWQCRQIDQCGVELQATAEYDVLEGMIPDEYKTVIYRITQEAINNAVKYAKAETLRIKLYHKGEFLELSIVDDGVGFNPFGERQGAGMGLLGMRERADSVGAMFDIQSEKGKGVEIRVRFPLESVALSG